MGASSCRRLETPGAIGVAAPRAAHPDGRESNAGRQRAPDGKVVNAAGFVGTRNRQKTPSSRGREAAKAEGGVEPRLALRALGGRRGRGDVYSSRVPKSCRSRVNR